MLNLYLLYYITGVVNIFMLVLFFLFLVIACVGCGMWMGYSSDRHENPYNPKDHPRRYELCQKGKKLFFKWGIVAFIMLSLCIITPSKQEILTMTALKMGDDYFEKNPKSALSPSKIIGTFDATAEELEKFMVKLPKILNKSIDIADKKLTKLNK